MVSIIGICCDLLANFILESQHFKSDNHCLRSYANTVIEDLAEMGKSMFFVFDMAGRLDPVRIGTPTPISRYLTQIVL